MKAQSGVDQSLNARVRALVDRTRSVCAGHVLRHVCNTFLSPFAP